MLFPISITFWGGLFFSVISENFSKCIFSRNESILSSEVVRVTYDKHGNFAFPSSFFLVCEIVSSWRHTGCRISEIGKENGGDPARFSEGGEARQGQR